MAVKPKVFMMAVGTAWRLKFVRGVLRKLIYILLKG